MKKRIFIVLLLVLAGCGPHTATDFYKEGVELFDKREYSQALAFLQEARKLDPASKDVLMYLAFTEYNMRYYVDAIHDFSIVINRDASNSEAYKFRGLAEYYCNDKIAACRDLTISSNLGNTRAYGYLQQYCK